MGDEVGWDGMGWGGMGGGGVGGGGRGEGGWLAASTYQGDNYRVYA